MKTTALTLAILVIGTSAYAQMGGMGGMGGGQPVLAQTPEDKALTDILELEQEVDKELLKQALTTLGIEGMRKPSELSKMSEDSQKNRKQDIAALEEQITAKKISIATRAAKIAQVKDKPAAARREQFQASRAKPKPDRLVLLEKLELTNADIQLLQRQFQVYQEKLTIAIDKLATAEFEASGGPDKQSSFEDAKKNYENIKSKYVDYGKQLQLEQDKALELQQQIGMNGMGFMGGMGGMGGGMR